MQIAICDDEQQAIDKLKKFLDKYDGINICCFKSFDEIKRCNTEFDIAFIDIRFGDSSGFDVAKYIKNINNDCIITFFSNYTEYMKQSFEYRAFRYILKEEPFEFIQKQVDETLDEVYSANKMLLINYKNSITNINTKDILYIEMINHTAQIYLSNGKIVEWYNTLDNIGKMLPTNFVRCNRSYIINLKKISGIKKNFVTIGDTEITIGRNYKNKVLSLI